MEVLLEELIDLIQQETCYQEYMKANQLLEKEENKALLLKHQSLQEHYLKYRDQLDEASCQKIREELKALKQAMLENKDIQYYYQTYQALNALLEDIQKMIFEGILE